MLPFIKLVLDARKLRLDIHTLGVNDMQDRTVLLLAILWLLSAEAAAACEGLANKTGGSPLETRRPVLGDKVRLTSGFGIRYHPLLKERRLHAGIEWAAPTGSPVIAAGVGRVVSSTVSAEFGNTVLIDHGGGWQTLYGYLAGFDVRQGDCVGFGTVIGNVGSTGLASGPALHFQVRRDGRPVDPLSAPVKY